MLVIDHFFSYVFYQGRAVSETSLAITGQMTSQFPAGFNASGQIPNIGTNFANFRPQYSLPGGASNPNAGAAFPGINPSSPVTAQAK